MFRLTDKLSEMSKTRWKFWHWEITGTKKDLGFVDTFEELKTLVDEHVDYDQDYFALFREGIKPKRSDENNVAAFTLLLIDNIRYDNNSYLKYFNRLWALRIFRFFYVNGIYCTPKKIQIFINFHPDNRPLPEIQGLLKSISFPFRKICHIRSDPEFTLLSRFWIEGFLEPGKFTIPFNPRFDDNRAYRTNRLESLIEVAEKQYHLSEKEPGVIINSMLLSKEEIRMRLANNRFIYLKVETSGDEANSIWFAMLEALTFKIFPHLPIITVAFCYYSNGTLEIGVYLTGKPEIFEPIKELHQQEANTFALWIGREIKKLVMEKIENSKIFGRITNAIPPKNLDFCNRVLEYLGNQRVYIEL